MNPININISRLGAVRDANISISPFMLFMGESGLGKSYVAFLSHYIYVLLSSDRLNHFFDNVDFKSLLDNASSGKDFYSISTAELFRWIDADALAYIRYMIGNDNLEGDVNISWPFVDENISFTYSEEIEGLANSEELIYSISTKKFTYNKFSRESLINVHALRILLQATLTDAVFNEYIRFEAHVLPPSRGGLMELNERPSFRSGMYDSFFDFKSALSRPSKIIKNDDRVLDILLQKVNNGTVAQKDEGFVFTTSDGINMPLTAAASSVKELAPFAMLLKKFKLSSSSILFEEPEAHLHPLRQQHVADLIAYALGKGAHIQITTHSDYFVKRLNLLIRLYFIAQKHQQKEIEELAMKIGLLPEVFLDPANISSYYLHRREDGSTEIIKYNIGEEMMIPFDSFEKTIVDDFTATEIVDQFEKLENL